MLIAAGVLIVTGGHACRFPVRMVPATPDDQVQGQGRERQVADQ
jgi:hypothetical protein